VNLYLPSDSLNGDKFDNEANTKVTPVDAVDDGWIGMDIAEKSIQEFSAVIEKSATILWNGPMGVFEEEPFSKGTLTMARSVAESSALSIVGGGDTDVAIHKAGESERITYISTGGGAFLALLEGEPLPGVAALDKVNMAGN